MSKKEKVIIIIGITILMVLALLMVITINSLYDKYDNAYPEKVIRAELFGEEYHNGNIFLIYERADGVILTINRKNNFGLTDEDVEIELVYKKTGNIKYYARKALLAGSRNNMVNDFVSIGTVNYKFVGINKIKTVSEVPTNTSIYTEKEDYIESLVSYFNEQEEMEFMIYLYNNYPEIFYDILSFYMTAE